jgi:hypothetical protein
MLLGKQPTVEEGRFIAVLAAGSVGSCTTCTTGPGARLLCGITGRCSHEPAQRSLSIDCAALVTNEGVKGAGQFGDLLIQLFELHVHFDSTRGTDCCELGRRLVQVITLRHEAMQIGELMVNREPVAHARFPLAVSSVVRGL